MDKDIVISLKTIILTLSLLFLFYLLYMVRPIIIILAVALIIVISVEHAVMFFQGQKVFNKPLSRSAAVLITYFLLIFVLIAILTIGFQPVVAQSQKLFVNISQFIKEIPGMEDSDFSVPGLLSRFSSVSENIFTTTFSLFSGVAGIFSVLIISVYMSLDWLNIKSRFLSLFTGDLKEEIQSTIREIETSIGHWVKGQMFLMLVVGIMSFVGLMVLQIESPVALSLIAGLLEIVPVLGPIIALILAGIVGFSDSVTKGIAVIGLFTLIQQLENNFLVPKIMHRVSGFSPLVILIALLVGSTLLGVIGAIIAVPTMMISVIILKRVLRYTPPIN